ncbi:MAG: exodeoxyribonuclease VII small subunit [Chloroflexota bacterium]
MKRNEQTYARLQELVVKLERGDLGLEATTALHGEGLALAKKCSELLEATERKIRRLQQNEAPPSTESGNQQPQSD